MRSDHGDRRLTPEELARLRRWERRMIGAFALSMTVLIVVLALSVVVLTPTVLLAVPLLLVAVGSALLQFSARCPYCGANLGLQTRLKLPDACKECGVAFRN
jgi:hypothetical protein